MKKIFAHLFVLSILFISFNAQAQKKKSKSAKNGDKAQIIDEDQSRVQFQLETAPDQVQVVNLDTNGVLMVFTLRNDQNIYINKYDKNLNKIYSTTLKYADNSIVSSIKEYNKKIYMLVIDDRSSSAMFTKNYQIIEFDYMNKSSKEVSGVFEKKRYMQDIIPCDGGVFISTLDCLTPGQLGTRVMLNCCALGIPSLFGYTKFPYKPYLISVDFKSKKAEEQLLEYPNQSAIMGGDLDGEKQELNLSIKNKVKKKDNKIYVSNYKLTSGARATKVKETEIELPLGKDFYSAKINTISSEEKLVFGTYGPETKYLTENASMVANGLYLSKIISGKCAYTTVLRFDEMETFMSKNKKKAVVDAKPKKEKTYSQGLLFHDIIEDEDQYILTAESYYPTYHYEQYYNASTKRYETRKVFDGYQYDKLLIIGFSKSGKKQWEQHIDLPYYKTFTPKVLLVRNEIVEDDLYFTLAYNDGTIKFVKLTKNNIVSQLSSKEEIENIEGETVLNRNFINGGVLYDNHYIVYGWETIVKDKDGKKNKSNSEAKQVMFINKIAVYPE